MGKTYKDKPDRYRSEDEPRDYPKKKKSLRFIPTKGRQNKPLKHDLDKYFI